MNEMADHVSGGGCKNFEDYAKCCGIIEGLAVAEREVLDCKSKIRGIITLYLTAQATLDAFFQCKETTNGSISKRN